MACKMNNCLHIHAKQTDSKLLANYVILKFCKAYNTKQTDNKKLAKYGYFETL